MTCKKLFIAAAVLASATAFAQAAPNDEQAPPPGEPQGRLMRQGPGGRMGDEMRMRQGGPGGDMKMRMPGPGGMPGMPGGKWWKDSRLAQEIGLTDQQAQQIDKAFSDHRLQLVDLHANLEKQELMLEPMMQADQPNEAQVTAQIDKVSQARAALEKSNAQMLFAMRRILSAEQWKKLQSRHHEGPEGFARDGQGPQGWQGRQPRPRGTRPGGPPQAGQPGAPPAPAAAPPQQDQM